jgi:hypothetical protein
VFVPGWSRVVTPNVSLPAAAAVWGISRRAAYRLAEDGLIRVARFGKRCTVPVEEVERVRLEGVYTPKEKRPLLLPRRGRQPGSGTRE